jgi:hypothetical protein
MVIFFFFFFVYNIVLFNYIYFYLKKGPIESTICLQKLERWPNVNAMKFFKKNDYVHFKKKIGE